MTAKKVERVQIVGLVVYVQSKKQIIDDSLFKNKWKLNKNKMKMFVVHQYVSHATFPHLYISF